MENGEILRVEDGGYAYPDGRSILDNVNISIRRGRMLAVLGPNGIGKTTLLKCMTGLLPWKNGKSILRGRDIKSLSPREIWSVISYIPQSHTLAFSFTGLEMVLLGRNVHLSSLSQPGERDVELSLEIMRSIGIEHLADKDCNKMSGGELQMVLIAKALVSNPLLIILDEPETGLDFHNQLLVLKLIDRLVHEKGISAVMNTHYPTNALSVADDAFMLDYEKGYSYGSTAEVLTAENIEASFRVNVVVNELKYSDRLIRSIVPVEISSGMGKEQNEGFKRGI